MTDLIAQNLSSKQSSVLKVFSRTLLREVHVLTLDPNLLWQQLHNRLQWEEDEVKQTLALELAHRTAPESKPWARLRTPYRESQKLIRTLNSHTNVVNECAVSPDGTWIVSASGDKTLKIWDVTNGMELRTLTGHTGAVNGCSISPDGTWIVSASSDNTLKMWDADSGRELRTLTGHKKQVVGCAVSADGTWIASASSDNTLKIWDASNGKELVNVPLLGALFCVSVHPWQPLMVCGDMGGNLYIVELVGKKYRKIIVTARRIQHGLIVRCPACQNHFDVTDAQLGSEMACPQEGCGLCLKVNLSVIEMA